MVKSYQKNVLAIHDLSGFGNTSLMAVLPVMYHNRIGVYALPTGILSANTCYEGYECLDTTLFMERCLEHWKSIPIMPDAIYSGFLGGPEQVKIVQRAIKLFASKHRMVIIDPVLADEGELYSCYDQKMVLAMRDLIRQADIITPNYTEACMLSGIDYHEAHTADKLSRICRQLQSSGARCIIITSVPSTDPKGSSVYLYHSETGSGKTFASEYLPYTYPGTGDIFCSMIVADIMNGIDLSDAIENAIGFIKHAILESQKYLHDIRTGVVLEQALQTWKHS